MKRDHLFFLTVSLFLYCHLLFIVVCHTVMSRYYYYQVSDIWLNYSPTNKWSYMKSNNCRHLNNVSRRESPLPLSVLIPKNVTFSSFTTFLSSSGRVKNRQHRLPKKIRSTFPFSSNQSLNLRTRFCISSSIWQYLFIIIIIVWYLHDKQTNLYA